MVQFSLTYVLNPQMVTSSYVINHLILATQRIRHPIADPAHHKMISLHMSLIWWLGFWPEITLRKLLVNKLIK